MKTSAIVRIILFSLGFMILLSILVGGIVIGSFISRKYSWAPSGTMITSGAKADPADFSNIKIEWTAGSITIVTADTDQIDIEETKDSNNPYSMVTEFIDDTLTIQYSTDDLSINFGSYAGKDLVVTVPEDWDCNKLIINGAALNIDISDLAIKSMELDGAATRLNFNGALGRLEYDGAAADLKLNCTNWPENIQIDGTACKMDLSIPSGGGYRVDADGLAIDFDSNCEYRLHDSAYTYGNANCHIDVSGAGCKITVNEN